MKRVWLTISAFAIVSSFAVVADDAQRTTGRKPFVIGNREEPTRTQLNAFTKIFLHDVREFGHEEHKLSALRVFFDPRYLEAHDLQKGKFPVETIAVRSLRYRIADDNRTAACVVGANDKEKELILLRFTVHNGKLYLEPQAPPHPTSRSFKPWILRMKLE